MDPVFSKSKDKRRRTLSESTSFVKNVTSRVTSLLPSTITKWFSSPSSSNTNGSAPTADITDSSTEDEALDSPVQPPSKRMRYNTPQKYDHFPPIDVNCSVGQSKPLDYIPYNATPYSNRGTHKTPVLSPSEDGIEQSDREMTNFQSEHTVSHVGQSVAGKRKSIFDTYGTEESRRACLKTSRNVIRDPNQPCFKPSLLWSPFYPGRTMYGGASSSYVNQPNIKQQKVAVVNQSNSTDDSAISGSARRIMDLLEQYSSPLIEAKRIPNYTRPQDNSFNNSPERNSPYSNRNMSYKIQELHVPSIASILRLKQRSRLMDTTSAARQIIASHSSALDYQPYPTSTNMKQPDSEQSNKMTTKVKTRVARANRGNQNDFEVATPIKLQTVALSIDPDKLPKFSVGTPAAQLPATAFTMPKTFIDSTLNKKNTEISNNKETVISSINFKFSNPARVSCGTAENETPIPKYTFYSPERRVEQKLDQNKDSISPELARIVKAPENAKVQSNDWKCSDCWVSNKAEVNKCACCGAKQPSSADKGAKCTMCKLADSQALKDKCVNCEKIQINNVASPIAPKASAATKWKCDECWVSNDDSAEKCACCGAGKAKKPGVAPPTPMHTAALAPKTADVEWKCEDCWISNKSSADKCVACGGAKPGTERPAAHSSPFFKPSSDSFKNLVQTQKAEKWECPSCLVRNEMNVSACVCCGAERENNSKMPGNKFNFGLNTSFKFGINPDLREATLAKKPQLESQESGPPTELKEQEKNNNILAETPTFTLPVKKPEEKTEPPKAKPDEGPKPSFSFGIPKQSAPAPATTAVHLSPTKKLLEDREKPQEVPQVKLSAPEHSKPSGGMFSLPPASSAMAASTMPTPPSADAKNDVTSVSITLKPAATTAAKPQQQNTFTFGAASLKPTMFGTPTTTAAESEPSHGHSRNLFTPPAQTTVASTTAPTMSFKPTDATSSSLFQKPNPTTTSTVSFFQSGETSTTAPTQSVASTAPSFSFGSAAARPASAADKSSFFSFGNSATKTTDAPPPAMFKTQFGAAAESTADVNSFGLPTGNTLLGSNSSGGVIASSGDSGMVGGALSSGSVVTTSNPLGGSNSLATNPLAGGNRLQSGNGLSGGTSNLFSSSVQKDNVWTANAPSTNMFVPSTTTNSLQKPAGFTFGSSGSFNASGSTPAFGGSAQPAQNNIFGIANPTSNTNSRPSMFSTTGLSQQPASLFGAPQPAAAGAAPQMGMFGSPAAGATPTFGGQNPSVPSFETPTMTPAAAPAPAFNFGGQQPAGMFGFGQQQQPQQAGVYNFGGAPAGNGQVQFSIGSSANASGRRMRKAVRRNPPR